MCIQLYYVISNPSLGQLAWFSSCPPSWISGSSRRPGFIFQPPQELRRHCCGGCLKIASSLVVLSQSICGDISDMKVPVLARWIKLYKCCAYLLEQVLWPQRVRCGGNSRLKFVGCKVSEDKGSSIKVALTLGWPLEVHKASRSCSFHDHNTCPRGTARNCLSLK